MRYCRRCGVLYSEGNACCPKCNAMPAVAEQPEPPAADRRLRAKQWIALCIGIPAMIAVFTLFFRLIGSAAQ